MSSLRSIAGRCRNAMRRLSAKRSNRPPSGVVANDIIPAHHALAEFCAGFAAQQRVRIDGHAAYAADLVARNGAAVVLGLLPSAAALADARNRYQSANLRYEHRDSPEEAHDLIITRDASTPRQLELLKKQLSSAGKLALVQAPAQADPPLVLAERLQTRFAGVRRFVQQTAAPGDGERPSTPTTAQFSFDELSLDASVPDGALSIIYLATDDSRWSEGQLHLGCGPVSLPGWINVDNQPYAGVDFCWNLARGIPFRENRYIFAEHFLEHLAFDDALAFLRTCRRHLTADGILRLSTPNLDWVWYTSYHPQTWQEASDAEHDCFVLNRAFRGWGHQFLYNHATITALLHNAGFGTVQAFSYGMSATPSLRNLEHHEQYPDTQELPHIIIVEASGYQTTPYMEAPIANEYRRDIRLR